MASVNRNEPQRAKSSESTYSMMEFMREFADDRACLDYLWRTRYADDGHHAHCPKCDRERKFHRVKDRPAYRMIRAAELSGEMTPDKTILDATSGNTGIAYAMIGARRGYRVKLLMPANASIERKKLLQAYGISLTARPKLSAGLRPPHSSFMRWIPVGSPYNW